MFEDDPIIRHDLVNSSVVRHKLVLIRASVAKCTGNIRNTSSSLTTAKFAPLDYINGSALTYKVAKRVIPPVSNPTKFLQSPAKIVIRKRIQVTGRSSDGPLLGHRMYVSLDPKLPKLRGSYHSSGRHPDPAAPPPLSYPSRFSPSL